MTAVVHLTANTASRQTFTPATYLGQQSNQTTNPEKDFHSFNRLCLHSLTSLSETLCNAMEIWHGLAWKREKQRYVQVTNTNKKLLLALSINDPENVQARKDKEKRRPPMTDTGLQFQGRLGRALSWYDVRQNADATSSQAASSTHILVALSLAGNQSPDSFMLRSMPRFLAASSTVRSRSFNTASSVSTTL